MAATATATKSKIRIRPLGDKVLVKRVDVDNQTKGGIYLPESAKEKPQEATVLAVGEGKTLENGTTVPMQVKVGDRVLLGKWGGTEIKLDDQELLIVGQDEILGIVQ
jgi:chaperonin GroES